MSGLAAEAASPAAESTPPPVTVLVDEPTVVVAEPENDMPLPTDARTIFLGGLFALACLAAMYVASEIILPIALAIVLKLLLQPLVRTLEHLHVPRLVGALVAVLLLVGIFAGLVTALATPAVRWAGKLPEALPRFEQQVQELGRPLQAIQHAVGEAERLASGTSGAAPATQGGAATTAVPAASSAKLMPTPSTVAASATKLVASIFSGTRVVVAGVFTTLLVLFYLLVSGETFLRRLVEILPRYGEKKLAVEISLKVEHDISAYLLTITLINAIVGCATGLVMWACGIGDPLLWGVIAFILNYVPVLGPLAGILLFAVVGVLSKGAFLAALLPAGLYLLIHLLEGETITPMILARRFTINPVVVVVSLVFWYWMWGVPGAVLSVPMLAIAKIICDDVPQLRAFGHFLEG